MYKSVWGVSWACLPEPVNSAEGAMRIGAVTQSAEPFSRLSLLDGGESPELLILINLIFIKKRSGAFGVVGPTASTPNRQTGAGDYLGLGSDALESSASCGLARLFSFGLWRF